MNSKNLYIIAGPNGAGKTTASFTILPELLDCREFINADEIAKGLSPFQPESVSIEAGRIMLNRIHELIRLGRTFAFETTLASLSFVKLIERAKLEGYTVSLLFFWLSSPEFAVKRVSQRVLEGGHFVEENVIRRRFDSGLRNFFSIYRSKVDFWTFIKNDDDPPVILASSNSILGTSATSKQFNELEGFYGKE